MAKYEKLQPKFNINLHLTCMFYRWFLKFKVCWPPGGQNGGQATLTYLLFLAYLVVDNSVRHTGPLTLWKYSNPLWIRRAEGGSSDSTGWFYHWWGGTVEKALGRKVEVMKWTVRRHIYQISSQYLDTWSPNLKQNGGEVSSGERTAEIRCYSGCLLNTVNISPLRICK